MTAAVEKIAGEGKGELVFSGERGAYKYLVSREYEGGPWTWMILEGKDPVAFGDATDSRAALLAMSAELDSFAPPPDPPRPGGLVGLLGRLLWGDR